MKPDPEKVKLSLPFTPSLVPQAWQEQQLYIKKLEKRVQKLKLKLAKTQEKDLLLQNKAKKKRAAELKIANKELIFQNEEKEKRAAELAIANIELIYQNGEKEKRAAELVIANMQLVFENTEKGKRASELAIANIELIYQNNEKEKRASELNILNKELQAFAYISSHDLQEPLRKIQTFANIILTTEFDLLSPQGKDYFTRMHNAANRMQTLIKDLLEYSHTNINERKFETADLQEMVGEVSDDLAESIKEKNVVIRTVNLGKVFVNQLQFRQVIFNLLTNAIKFSKPDLPSEVTISYNKANGLLLESANPGLSPGKLSADKNYCHLKFSDNGIGFDNKYKDQIFEVFQRLHTKELYAGTGIGLAIVKKIICNHGGAITSHSESGEGATFDIYLPENEQCEIGSVA